MAGGRRRSGAGTRTARAADPLTGALESLTALESRMRSLEDRLTSGDAMELPDAPRPSARTEREPSFAGLEAALLVGTMVRRINLRLGAIERALDDRAPLRVRHTMNLRAPRRLKSLSAAVKTPSPTLVAPRSGAAIRRPRAN